MKSRITFTALLLCWMSCVWAQTVSTVLTNPGARFEGIAWGENGLIYTVDFASGKVFKLTLNGDIQQIGPAFNGALGGTMDKDQNFYFSEFNTGKIIKFKPDDTYETYASGLTGPTGILIDEVGKIMYVANWSGNSISKIDMTSATPSPVTLASGGRIKGPDGLAFSPEGDIISANFNDNNIQKITPDGEVSAFATIEASSNSGYIVWVKDHYYITGANGSADVYKITVDGEVSVFAGSGINGYADGDAATAKFIFPNGIATNAAQDSLILTESGTEGRIRLISDLGTDSVATSIIDLVASSISIQPNPTSDYLYLTLDLPQKNYLSIHLLDSKGSQLDTILNQENASGKIEVSYQLSERIVPGVYIVQIKTRNELLSRKIIVK